MPAEPTVLLVDDDDLYRAGMATLLADLGIRSLASVATGVGSAGTVERYSPDVVVTNLFTSDGEPAPDLEELVAAHPDQAIVALVAVADDASIWRALRAGARGYVLKADTVHDLSNAVREVADGRAWLSPLVAARAVHFLKSGATPQVATPPDMSAREVQVLRLLAAGFDNNQIADELQISSKTAKNHVASIIAKLGVRNRVQAAVFAVRSGLA